MKIDTSSNTASSAYETTAAGSKEQPISASTPSVSTDTVTLSDEAMQLTSGLSTLATAIAALPLPDPPQPQAQRRKKQQAGGLTPMLDVDAFRLIRDKLRSQNLGLAKSDPVVKKQKDAVQDENKI